MTRREQRIGKHGQDIAAAALRMRGVLLVEQIATPVRLIPHRTARGYFRVIFSEEVAGDHRGVLASGISVLAETKTLDHNLRYSDLRPHQPEKLSDHAKFGISLLVWVHSSGVYVMRWPIPDFAPGTGIPPEEAAVLDAACTKFLGDEEQERFVLLRVDAIRAKMF